MKFRPGKIYTDVLNLAFGDMPSDDLCFVLQDGRPTAFLFHAYLLSHFDNLFFTSTRDYAGDFVEDTNGNVFQVKVITESGVCMLPSRNRGAGRYVVGDEVENLLQSLFGVIFVDVADMPKVTYAGIQSNYLRNQTTYSRSSILDAMHFFCASALDV